MDFVHPQYEQLGCHRAPVPGHRGATLETMLQAVDLWSGAARIKRMGSQPRGSFF